jgi:hypothetical protein
MIKIQKHLKRENVCTSYQGHPTERPLVVLNPISMEIQAGICIVIYHQHLVLKPVKENIVILDDRSYYVPGHESTPSQHPWIPGTR